MVRQYYCRFIISARGLRPPERGLQSLHLPAGFVRPAQALPASHAGFARASPRVDLARPVISNALSSPCGHSSFSCTSYESDGVPRIQYYRNIASFLLSDRVLGSAVSLTVIARTIIIGTYIQNLTRRLYNASLNYGYYMYLNFVVSAL